MREALETVPALKKAKAILAVDIFGLPANWPEINRIATEYNLITIDDAAQSFGAKIGNTISGNFAGITCTSFFPTKPLGCFGDGGAIFTNNEDWAETLRSLRVHGASDKKYFSTAIGTNSRLDAIQAAVLLEKILVFDEDQSQKQWVVERMRTMFPADNFVLQSTHPSEDNFVSSNALFSLRVRNRDTFALMLQDSDIPSNIYYPVPISSMPPYKTTLQFPVSLWAVQLICNSILSIPIPRKENSSDYFLALKNTIERYITYENLPVR